MSGDATTTARRVPGVPASARPVSGATGAARLWAAAPSVRSVRRRAFLAAALVWLAAGPAAAADGPFVTVVDLSADEAAPREIAHDVSRAVKRLEQVRYRDANETLHIGGEDIHVNNVKGGDTALRSAKKKLDEKRWDDAAEDLETSVSSYLSSFAVKLDQEQISEAMVLLGVAYQLSGDKKGAVKAYVRATEFRPRDEHDLSAFPGAVADQYGKARAGVLARAQISYEVRTTPPHAEVWVNGRYAGLSPTFIAGYPGPQYIRVDKHGYARFGKVEQMDKGGDVVEVELEPARRKPAWDSIKERLADVFLGAVEPNDLTELQGLTASSTAVIMLATGTREKMKVQLALANLNGRQVVNRVDLDLPWMRRDKDALDALVAKLFKAPEVPPDSRGPKVVSDSVFRKWWFWAVIGGAAVGSVTAWWLLSDEDPIPPKYPAGTGGLVIKF